MQKDLHKNTCDEQIFNTLFRKHSKNLHDFLFYKYGESNNPADLVQEAFLKLWGSCQKVAPDKAKSFLFTVANNLMLNQLSHQKVVLKHQKIPQKDRTNENPEYLMEETQYHEKLEKAIAGLTEGQREAFLLNRVEGKKHKEIAALLNISTKAVEKRIYGALNSLREQIEGL